MPLVKRSASELHVRRDPEGTTGLGHAGHRRSALEVAVDPGPHAVDIDLAVLAETLARQGFFRDLWCLAKSLHTQAFGSNASRTAYRDCCISQAMFQHGHVPFTQHTSND